MKTTSFKGSKFNLKSILTTQAQEFQCPLQKSYGVCATETKMAFPLPERKI